MNIYSFNAGGYYAMGTIIVAATDREAGLELANNASDSSLDLTYHGIIGADPIGTSPVTSKQVLRIHEWGMPELPAKGSGKKVTF